jgi:hypothetical protein
VAPRDPPSGNVNASAAELSAVVERMATLEQLLAQSGELNGGRSFVGAQRAAG